MQQFLFVSSIWWLTLRLAISSNEVLGEANLQNHGLFKELCPYQTIGSTLGCPASPTKYIYPKSVWTLDEKNVYEPLHTKYVKTLEVASCRQYPALVRVTQGKHFLSECCLREPRNLSLVVFLNIPLLCHYKSISWTNAICIVRTNQRGLARRHFSKQKSS